MRAYARPIAFLIAGIVALVGAIVGTHLGNVNALKKYVIDINSAVAELVPGGVKIRMALTSPTYVMTVDTHGKVLILSVNAQNVAPTDYVVAYCNGTQIQKPLGEYTVIGVGICKIYVKCSAPLLIKIILSPRKVR